MATDKQREKWRESNKTPERRKYLKDYRHTEKYLAYQREYQRELRAKRKAMTDASAVTNE